MLKFYFARMLAHFAALMAIPVLWWYVPKVPLFVIRLNTAAAAWLIHQLVELIPNETLRFYALGFLKAGDILNRLIHKGLLVVPADYRDQVEVLARVRYEPGGWLLVGELAIVLLLTWRLLRRRREMKLLQGAPRVEPAFD